jgi:hypothetical protein
MPRESLKFTPQFLRKLEELIDQAGYTLRYEKGHFNSGYCLMNNRRIAVVNKFFPLEGKINALYDIICKVEVATEQLSGKQAQLYQQLRAPAKEAAS